MLKELFLQTQFSKGCCSKKKDTNKACGEATIEKKCVRHCGDWYLDMHQANNSFSSSRHKKALRDCKNQHKNAFCLTLWWHLVSITSRRVFGWKIFSSPSSKNDSECHERWSARGEEHRRVTIKKQVRHDLSENISSCALFIFRCQLYVLFPHQNSNNCSTWSTTTLFFSVVSSSAEENDKLQLALECFVVRDRHAILLPLWWTTKQDAYLCPVPFCTPGLNANWELGSEISFRTSSTSGSGLAARMENEFAFWKHKNFPFCLMLSKVPLCHHLVTISPSHVKSSADCLVL